MNAEDRKISIGEIYKHFKGNIYIIKYISKKKPGNKEYINYQEYNPKDNLTKVYSRPKDMFIEKVNGEDRFKLISNSSNKKSNKKDKSAFVGIEYYSYQGNTYMVWDKTMDTETEETLLQIFNPVDGINPETGIPNKLYCVVK